MRKHTAVWCIVAAITAGALVLEAKSKKGGKEEPRPGKFDYYVLSLSWSPEHCATSKDPIQCQGSRKFSFIVHGLWPQYERGWPADCKTTETVPPDVVKDMLEIMPSPKLIQHEWLKHGSCSGLAPEPYFEKAQNAYLLVKIPPEFKEPDQDVQLSPGDVKKRFAAANPDYGEKAFAEICRGKYLQEVRVCYTKDLKPRACSASVTDSCKANMVIVRPVR
jgi:ribonuclease T2